MLVVTLTTDFGTTDGYVAAMKGVILRAAPDVRLVDITHDVPAEDVHHAAYVIHSVFGFFPEGTIHLAVVDPGVGGARRAIAVEAMNSLFVSPDNGLLSYVLVGDPQSSIVELPLSSMAAPDVSCTFHGRDLFAPAAASLACGQPLSALGSPLFDPVVFRPRLVFEDSEATGEVLHVDRFGNLASSLGVFRWEGGRLRTSTRAWATAKRGETSQPGRARLEKLLRAGLDARDLVATVAGWRLYGICHTYSEVAQGEVLALIGSTGLLEVAVRDGNAASILGACRGAAVSLRIRDGYVRGNGGASASRDDACRGAQWPSS